ncbi:MAG: Crp/Fnr family transcriptional regulator [Bacteroidota bacterium]
MHNLTENIGSKIHLTPEIQRVIEEHFIAETFPKNHVLIKEGQYVQKLFFLEEGMVRSFHYAEDKEVNSWFYTSNQFFTSWYSFHEKNASLETMETLEPSLVYAIDHSSYHKLMDTYTAFQKLGRLIAEEQLAFVDYYSRGYMFMSAKERYDLLLSFFPDIELRIKLGHIASFLGVSQETLSRIRRNK